MEKCLQKIRENKGIFLVMAVIIFFGIALRTYNFHNFLRFNPDQARDAAVADKMLEKNEIPLLGPKAGGTEFKLGPIFYYFQAASGKIFGNTPESYAYPDLITSILFISLLYFFLRLYFDRKISLGIMALTAVSYFNVRYSRFGWNPNSMPFWSLLFVFSMIKIFNDEKENSKIFWAVAAGISVGVGVQLHTLLLVIMPVFCGLVFLFALYKKMPVKKYFAIIFLLAFMLNIPQGMQELKTGGKNVKAFFAATEDKRGRNKTFLKSFSMAVACTAQANSHIVSGVGEYDTCNFLKFDKKNGLGLFGEGLGILLFFGGIYIFIVRLRKERDLNRQNFLALVALYATLYFLILIPVAADVSMRFYLGAGFVAFFMLGLIFQFLEERIEENKKNLAGLIGVIFILSATNLLGIYKEFAILGDSRAKVYRGDAEYITLGELDQMAAYIASQKGTSQVVYVDGKNTYLFKALKPLQYVGARNGLKIEQLNRESLSEKLDQKLFIISLAGDKSIDAKRFGRYLISVQ